MARWVLAAALAMSALTMSPHTGASAPVPRIVFAHATSAAATARHDLYVINVDGTGLRPFVHDAAQPAVSPDGRTIAFIRHGEVWAMSADGTAQRQITWPVKGWAAPSRPAWSPDGATIYFSRPSVPAGGSALFAIALDATGLQELTRRGDCDTGPAASPDGRLLAFDRVLGACIHGKTTALRAIDTKTRRVLRSFPFALPRLSLHDPAWSRDGKAVAYTSTCDGRAARSATARRCYALFVSRRSARPRRLLTATILQKSFAHPAWSPDGSRIAFASSGRYGRIWVVDVKGDNARRLTTLEGIDADPAWLP